MIPPVTMTAAVARAWRPGLADGQGSDELIAFYSAVIPKLGPGQWWAEIGCNYGRSLLCAAELLVQAGPGCVLFGVDPWQGQQHPDPLLRSKCSFRQALQSIALNARPAELEILYLLRMASVSAAKGIDNSRLTGVMIDGDHRLEAVAADIQAWAPKVRPGGLLAGHDYAQEFPGVRQAVDQAFGGCHELRGTVWVIQTPAEPEAEAESHSQPAPRASSGGRARRR